MWNCKITTTPYIQSCIVSRCALHGGIAFFIRDVNKNCAGILYFWKTGKNITSGKPLVRNSLVILYITAHISARNVSFTIAPGSILYLSHLEVIDYLFQHSLLKKKIKLKMCIWLLSYFHYQIEKIPNFSNILII